MYNLAIHPEADKEFNESVIWYNNQKEKLGEQFIAAVESIIKKIQSSPEIYGYSKKPFREAGVSIFPFIIVYRFIKPKQVIHIISIFHTSRNPKNKYRKIE